MLRPDNDSWAAVLYDSADPGAQRLSTVAVIDGYPLSCPACTWRATETWSGSSFPKAAGLVDRRASRSNHLVAGVERAPGCAVLKLAESRGS